MVFSDIMSGLGGVLLTLAIPVGIIWLIVKFVRILQAGDGHLAMEQLKRSSLGIAIAVLVPLFLNFLVTSILPAGAAEGPAATFQLGFGLGLGLIVFLLGTLARRVPVVSGGLSSGGLFYTVYIVALHFPDFSALTQLTISLLALLAVIGFGYWLQFRDLRRGLPASSLTGIRAFGIGLLTYFFSNLVIIHAGNLVRELSGGSADALQTEQFMVVLGLAIVFLVAGLVIRVVRPVSSGLLITGLLSLIIAIFMSFASVGRVAAAVTTGLALLLLIIFAYVRFSHPAESAPNKKPSA